MEKAELNFKINRFKFKNGEEIKKNSIVRKYKEEFNSGDIKKNSIIEETKQRDCNRSV